MDRILIVGASRGLGLEFVRQYTAAGAQVLATHRGPAEAATLRALGAEPIELDVRQEGAAAALAGRLQGAPLQLAILVAGVFGPRGSGLAGPTATEFDLVMQTNVLAPMRLIPALAASLAQGQGRLAVLSSRMGSIGGMESAYGWLYRASKAALNCVLRAASLELGARGVVCVALHPGWVRTDMGGAGADLEAVDSVAEMRRVLAAINRSHNGRFLNYNGEQLPW